jgi:Domain of unknown function (DUF1707)
MSTPAHRVSDAEREAVAERLRQAAAEGRLDTDELSDRVERAYSAQTAADLEPLTADLPVPKPSPLSIWQNEDVRRRLVALFTANPICIAVWALTGSDGSFWPKWVLLGTAAALIVTLVHAYFGIEEEQHLPGAPPPPPQLPHER